jgi:hypothetical protein
MGGEMKTAPWLRILIPARGSVQFAVPRVQSGINNMLNRVRRTMLVEYVCTRTASWSAPGI